MKTILTIVGTRPEAIKLAPVIHRLEEFKGEFKSVVCATGQHRDLTPKSFRENGIRPNWGLYLPQDTQNLSQLTAVIVARLDKVFDLAKPDCVIVHGDTTSAFCGALVGHCREVTVAHVEAGLRSGDRKSPFPEEFNRSSIGLMADLHFAPTSQARFNLIDQGADEGSVFMTGNTIVDALMARFQKFRDLKLRDAQKITQFANGRKIVLVTIHRRENHGVALENICHAIRDVATAKVDVAFVWPLHPNPDVRGPVTEMLGDVPNVHLVDPLDHDKFLWLLAASHAVLTDSGGVQEEAVILGRPVLVARETTERKEGLEFGHAKLVGCSQDRVEQGLIQALRTKPRRLRAELSTLYGDGRASERIVDVLRERITGG